MYTLPGDVIVYEQVDPVELDPAGHVDIRTYHGFMSDFVWRIVPSLGGATRPNKRYRVIGVFRKISDTMAMIRVQAFLRIIRELEAKDYKRPYQALRRQNGKEINFESYELHPGTEETRELVAGAYQIMWSTWNDTIKATGWPRKFTPEMQDRIALYLLNERPFPKQGSLYPRRTALGYLMEGKVEDAINETRLWTLWACLPGGGKQQQTTMSELRVKFDRYVKDAIL